MTDLLNALFHAVAYALVGGVMLVAAYYVLDLATPGHLGTHLRGVDENGMESVHAHSRSAGVVTSAWLVSNAAVLFTAIWTNGETSLGWALGATVAFGALGFIDDALGDNNEKGLKGHVTAALHGRVTTGFIKLGGGASVALVVAGAALGRREFTDLSHRVFVTERRVRFVEMEYAVPRESLLPLVREVVAATEAGDWRIAVPVEVRTAAADDIGLSTASGRDTGYVAVHVPPGSPDQAAFFAQVERLAAQGLDRVSPELSDLHAGSPATGSRRSLVLNRRVRNRTTPAAKPMARLPARSVTAPTAAAIAKSPARSSRAANSPCWIAT